MGLGLRIKSRDCNH